MRLFIEKVKDFLIQHRKPGSPQVNKLPWCMARRLSFVMAPVFSPCSSLNQANHGSDVLFAIAGKGTKYYLTDIQSISYQPPPEKQPQ
jgi:hypothetical protein